MTVRIDGAKFHADGCYSTDDELNVTVTNGGLQIEVDEPWAGDTETGFGKKCQISIDGETAQQLRDFLNEWFPARTT